MSALSTYQQQEHLERIREYVARNPNAGPKTVSRALASLSEHPIELDIAYVSRCIKKIRAERKHRDWGSQTERLAQIEDLTRIVQRVLWGITSHGMEPDKEGKRQLSAAVAALAKIGEFEYDLLKAQMDLGVFNRNLGTIQHGVDDDTLQRLTAYVAAGLRFHFTGGRGTTLRAPDQLVAGVPEDQK